MIPSDMSLFHVIHFVSFVLQTRLTSVRKLFLKKWKNTCALVECRISCEFLMRNFLLFAHATMFEQNNLNQIWKFSNKHFLFNFRFALRTRCVFQFSQHFNFMVKHDESLFRLKPFPSRVGWEGFAPFYDGEVFVFPSLCSAIFTHPRKPFPMV